MLTDLTDVELTLIDAARRGKVLVCSDLDHDQLRVTEDSDLQVRGQVVRELLLGRHGELDPRGIEVVGARITGELDLNHVTACQGLSLTKCVADRPVLLRFAQLPWLALMESRLPAVNAEGAHIAGNLFLSQTVVHGMARINAVTLLDAHIGGLLDMNGSHLTSNTGPALDADRLKVDGGMFLDRQFTASGNGEYGAVCLTNIHAGSYLHLSTAHLTNPTGPALYAVGATIEGNVDITKKLTASGTTAIDLEGARIGGRVTVHDAELTSSKGPLLDLRNARAEVMFLDIGLICAHSPATGGTCPSAERQLDVNGFVYTYIAGIHNEWQRWLHLLRCHTPSYAPMPYQQLAAIRTAAGHDRDARRILIVQQQDHRARGDIGGPLRRAAHLLWGALAGYGYRTGRTALALLIVLLLAGGMGWWAGHTETAPGRHAAEHPTKYTACSPVELIGLGIDRGLPLASTGIRARCDLDTASVAGQWFTVAIWLLQAAVWALATLALAGYTGLVRKIR